MKKKDRKYARNIEHRGNDHEVAKNFLLEMKLVRNINKPAAVYSLEEG